MKKVLTLAMVCTEDEVLLGMKKRGFGAGRWNGFGGKVELGETIEVATKRELREEVGLEAAELQKVGILNFLFQSEDPDLEVHIFRIDEYQGQPVETEEMRPQWFLWDSVPYQEMWPDDEFWLPLLRRHELFMGEFLFDRPTMPDKQPTIISHKLELVATLP